MSSTTSTPTPGREAVLPTVTLAPPPLLVPSRHFHVDTIAIVPLTISAFIMTITAIYVWKLWQREDKYYVEEIYSEDEYEDEEKGQEYEPGVPADIPANPIFPVREGNPATPESLDELRAEERARGPVIMPTSPVAEIRARPADIPGSLVAGRAASISSSNAQSHNFSRPLNKKPENTPIEEEDSARQSPSFREVTARKPVPAPTPSPLSPSKSPPAVGSPIPTTSDTASIKSMDSWERDSSASPGPKATPGITHNDSIAEPPARLQFLTKSPVQYGHDNTLLSPDTNQNNSPSEYSSGSTPERPVSDTTEVLAAKYGGNRKSGIDWGDGSSVVRSDYGYSVYTDKYANY